MHGSSIRSGNSTSDYSNYSPVDLGNISAESVRVIDGSREGHVADRYVGNANLAHLTN